MVESLAIVESAPPQSRQTSLHGERSGAKAASRSTLLPRPRTSPTSDCTRVTLLPPPSRATPTRCYQQFQRQRAKQKGAQRSPSLVSSLPPTTASAGAIRAHHLLISHSSVISAARPVPALLLVLRGGGIVRDIREVSAQDQCCLLLRQHAGEALLGRLVAGAPTRFRVGCGALTGGDEERRAESQGKRPANTVASTSGTGTAPRWVVLNVPRSFVGTT